MPTPKPGHLLGAAIIILVASLMGLGCQGDMMYVPPGARVTMVNAPSSGSPVQTAGYQPGGYQANGFQPNAYQAGGFQSNGYRGGVTQAGCPTCGPGGQALPGSGGQSLAGYGPNGQPMVGPDGQGMGGRPLPSELQKVSLPPYMVEPPDILLVDAIRFVPKPPYRIEALDQLLIQATETFPNQPIAGTYTVSPDGFVILGFSYGSVRIVGLTLEGAEAAIRTQLGRLLKNPQVSVGLAVFRGIQQVRGEHLVRPDGTISLGTYGCVAVAGLTLAQIKTVIEAHLSKYLQDPEVSVDVFAYNSKAYYVIADGAGYGQTVYKFPHTGNETVLDAIQRAGGIPAVGSKRKIWVARPAPPGHPCDQVLPVDWLAISQGGSTATNYQLFPGDRIYISSDPLIHLDYTLAKIISPIERVLGIVLLGTTTVNTFRSNGNGNNGTGFIVTR